MKDAPRYSVKPSIVLRKAKEIHNQKGHGPAFGQNRDGSMCVGYALVRAANELATYNPCGTWQEARNYVEVDDMSLWNDEIGQPGHTGGECDEMFDRAIKLAE